MDNTLQKRAKRISLVLTLAAVLFTAVDNYLYLCHGINISPVTTPVIIILVVSIVLCGVLQRYIYRWLIKYSLSPSANRQKLEADKTEHTRAVVTEQAENRAETIGIEPVKEATDVEAGITAGPHRDPYMERYNQLLEEMKQQEARRHAELMEAIREYVTVATAPFLSQKALDTLLTNIEQIACGRTDSCLPLRSNPDRPLRSPELRHLAWNIGERLHISLEERARFIKLSFPHELNNATVEYLQRNLRVAVPSHIPIDIPDEDDFRFHLELIGVHRKNAPPADEKMIPVSVGLREFIPLVCTMLNPIKTMKTWQRTNLHSTTCQRWSASCATGSQAWRTCSRRTSRGRVHRRRTRTSR